MCEIPLAQTACAEAAHERALPALCQLRLDWTREVTCFLILLLRCPGWSAAAAASADAATAPGGLSAEEMQAAMQSVEDETDQAAAQALQLETEAELAEFNADPAPKPLDPEGDEDDNDAEDTRFTSSWLPV